MREGGGGCDLHVIPRYHDRGKDRMELPFEPGMPADPEVIAERARMLAALLWARATECTTPDPAPTTRLALVARR